MTQDSHQQHPSRKKITSAGHWLYRLGIVFSAVLAFMQVVYDMGNRFVSRNAAETASEQQSGLLKYEAPSFRIYGDMFVNQALASTMSPMLVMTGTGTSTPVASPPVGHR